MIIDLYCAGSCRDNGQPTQIAACGLVLQLNAKDFAKHREFTYGLGCSTINLADIQAIRLALMSVSHKYRLERIVVHTPSKYVASLLVKNENQWAVTSTKNMHAIVEMRRWFEFCKNATVVIDAGSGIQINRAKELARAAIDTQKFTDSLTRDKRATDG